jgi:CRISPR type III-A-associated RAMP protein Csm4
LLKPGDHATETAHWMLSLFHPAENDAVDWERGNYSVTTRSGRVESAAGWGEMKKPTRMVTEGSVLISPSEPRGAAADVAPANFPHPVYRAGFALSLPVPLRPAS